MRRIDFLLLVTLTAVSGCGGEDDASDESSRKSATVSIPAPGSDPHPWVAGYERAPDASAADRGRVLLDALACGRCHELPANLGIPDRRGPDLGRIAERANPEWIAHYIADPGHVKPGTTMPAVLDGLTEATRRSEAIAQWLVSLKPGTFRPVAPDGAAVERGAALFHSVGCVACHAPQQGEGVESLADRSVPLPTMADKYDHDGLTAFLRRPLDHRPAGRMPDLKLSDREAGDIAHYLLRDTRVSGAVRYEARRGPVDVLDNLSRTRLERTGIADGFDLGVARRRNDFHLRFEAWLDVPAAGEWTFYLTSDDGSRLRLDGTIVAVIDKRDRLRKAEGKLTLAARSYELVAEYFQRGRESVLKIEWEGPGTARQPIPSDRLRSDLVPAEPYRPLVADAELIAEGARMFQESGCARCHEAPGAREGREAGHLAGPPIAGAGLDGCLGSAPPANYRLSSEQRGAIVAALAPAPPGEETPGRAAHRTMTALDCYACHERDGFGGVDEAHDPYFTSTADDQGTEGRIPPRINEVGDKLRAPWLKKVLVEGASVRPDFEARMPRFERGEMESLAVALTAADRRGDDSPEPDRSDATKEVGRLLVGAEGGLNCISCHHFARRKSASMQMVDLVGMPDRIHLSWYRRFMVNPIKMNPGSRMPAFAAVPEHFDRDAARQIDAVWAYIEDGERAVLPKGLSRQMRELLPGGEALTYRGKLRHGGYRGIAVGLPEGIHYSIDSERGRWASMWRGRFLDAGSHWGSQGMGRISPLSRDVVVPGGTGPDLAVLRLARDPWPDKVGRPDDYQFRGYRIGEKKRPTFHYEVAGVTVHDTARGREKEDSVWLERTLDLQSPTPVKGLWMRLGGGKTVEADGDGWRIDGKRRIVVRGGVARTVEGRDGLELRVPVEFDSGKAKIVVEYRW